MTTGWLAFSFLRRPFIGSQRGGGRTARRHFQVKGNKCDFTRIIQSENTLFAPLGSQWLVHFRIIISIATVLVDNDISLQE